MLKKQDISIEYVSPHLKIIGAVVRLEEGENRYEVELQNNAVVRIWGVRAQLRFYDKHGGFIGFEEDDHESTLEPGRKIALSLYAIPPAEYDQVRLTIDATAEEQDGQGGKDYLVALSILGLMVAGVAVYQLFKKL